jgi:iron(III) transport system ATP-binding protein
MTPSDKPARLQDEAQQWRGRAGALFAGNLTFENVQFQAVGRSILRDISFNLRPGEISCLLGPSGCGKSTLLKLAAGVERPSAGRIVLNGVEVAGSGRFVPPERRNVGMMFQDFALFPHMTALQNVAFGLTALPRLEAEKVALLALERVGLGALSGSTPAMLSGGEQQRVALARAIVPRPQVILMDEPFSNLDQRLKETVRADTLAILRETRATAMLVTHDPQEAMAFADVIHLMQAGRIVQQGTPEELRRHPVNSAAARFFRPYNVFYAVVGTGFVVIPVGRLKAPGLQEGTLAEILVPSEDLQIKLGGAANAVVLESRYVGPHWNVRLRLAETGGDVDAFYVAKAPLAKGQECRLAISPANTHIFPAEAPS